MRVKRVSKIKRNSTNKVSVAALRASPTDAVYHVCAKKDASLARERLMVLQQGLQTGALKHSA
jgi:hypothetical protein